MEADYERLAPRDSGFLAWNAAIPVHVMTPHVHAEHEINIVFEGEGVYTEDGCAPIPVLPRHVVFLPAGFRHAITVKQPIRAKTLLLHPEVVRGVLEPGLSGGAVERLGRQGPEWDGFALINPSLFTAFERLMDLAMAELGAGGSWRDPCLKRIASLTALYLAQLIEDDPEEPDPTRRRVLEVKKWIDRHASEAVTVAELAAMACLSSSHFSKCFQTLVGTSPMQYVNACRLERARTMLAGTGVPILEVALATGFPNLSHFNRTFKTAFGQTPGIYRRNRQKERRNPQD